AAGADGVAGFVSAAEGFARPTRNAAVAEGLGRLRPVAQAAAADGMALRGYVSCVTDCPFDGPTPPAAVARVAAALRKLGCAEVSLGDTIGRGRPEAVDAMLAAVLEVLPPERLAGHFHDTSGRAVENVAVALDRGLRVFDAAVGGLGGCPYAPGAAGDLATEGLADWLDGQGWDTGLDPAVLAEAAGMARAMRGG
ncbi:MAG TPA: hydroxymethylglutaryl-CoA lyase, partial [Paracoccaceae bacterium]|nr:hydroxymethylglutaryl-CoA lyase [Paracoccaceae bacterium]